VYNERSVLIIVRDCVCSELLNSVRETDDDHVDDKLLSPSPTPSNNSSSSSSSNELTDTYKYQRRRSRAVLYQLSGTYRKHKSTKSKLHKVCILFHVL